MKEAITFQNPTQNSDNQLFSVAGPTGVKAGAYDSKLKLVAATPDTCTDRPTVSDKDGYNGDQVNQIDLDENGVAKFVGHLTYGTRSARSIGPTTPGSRAFLSLSSSTLRATQASYNALRVPQPPRSILGITVTPDLRRRGEPLRVSPDDHEL